MPGMPRPVSDERDGLLTFLQQQRDAVRISAWGLTDEQARRAPTAGALSIGGLVKHLADMERTWTATITQARLEGDPNAYLDGFRMRDDDTLWALLDDYTAAARATDDAVATFGDLAHPVPVPLGVPWFPADVEAWSVRWVLLHLIEETAKHAGHADIVRESLDGATSFALIAAAENQPETEWIKPWRRG